MVVPPEACPFCAIFADPAAAVTKVFRISRQEMIIEPLDPVTPGHLLVVSRAHVANFAADPNVFEALAWAAAVYVHGFREPGDWNLITSMGPAASQTVDHLHIHLVPRHPGDGLELPWSA